MWGGVNPRIDKHLIQGGATIPLGVSSNVTDFWAISPFPQWAELCGDYFVFVTFECVDENLWFCHLNETFLGEFHVVLFISQDFMERNLEFFRNFHFALLKD